MKFSLVIVSERTGSTFSGNWLQNHVGTLETATARARRVEEVNSRKLTVGVVAEVASVVPWLEYHERLTRLDVFPV